MPSLNKIQIIGHVGGDPKCHVMEKSGQMVANFSVATTEKWKAKDGTWTEKTEWHRIVCWRYLAERAEKYVRKGGLVYVEGKMETRTWEKDGVKHYEKEVVASQLYTLDKRGRQDDATDSGQDETPPPQDDDNLPF